MHVYFVRHGHTDENVRHHYQAPNTPLNATGYDISRTVGEFLRPMNPTRIISSTYVRALETARIIGHCVGVTPTPLHHFVEVRWPTRFIGHSLYSLSALMFLCRSVLRRDQPNWHYEDAENFFDIFRRIQTSFRYIESLTEAHDSIVIVSHSEYIRLMVRYMCHDERLSLAELLSVLLSVNSLKNGEIVHVEYVGPTPTGTCPWILH